MWKYLKRLFSAAAETAPQHNNVVPIAHHTVNNLFDADSQNLKNRQLRRKTIETKSFSGGRPPPLWVQRQEKGGGVEQALPVAHRPVEASGARAHRPLPSRLLRSPTAAEGFVCA
jgi:hypothetical protein